MDVIASEAKQSLPFHNEIATACKAGLAMTTPQIASDRALLKPDMPIQERFLYGEHFQQPCAGLVADIQDNG